MKKAIKIIMFLLPVIIIVFIIALNTNDKETTEETSPEQIKKEAQLKESVKQNLPELISFDELIMNIKISEIGNGFTLTGECNLPDKTKVSFMTTKKDMVTAQNDAIVKNNTFKVSFGSKILDSDVIEVSCIINEFLQEKDVLNKLQSIEGVKESIKIDYNMNLLKKEYFAKILDIKLPFNPILTNVESLKDFSFMNDKRMNMNLIVDKEINDKELEDELRYKIYQILLKHDDSKAIKVRCFKPNEDFMFKSALFSPNGSWSDLNTNKSYSEYSILFN